ncbi:MAG: FAD-dependent oxidoreductase, partial [Chloroflexota bacterium]|nr:FAD-dependent oxidoreductase [Chloroflexota bacterium]
MNESKKPAFPSLTIIEDGQPSEPAGNGPRPAQGDGRHSHVVIVGSGPAGLTAALYAARANLNPLVIEGVTFGGQLMITSDVENYPGYPDGVLGPQMMQEFRAQAERFGTDYITDDVTRVDFSERPIRLWAEGRQYTAD